MFQPPTDSLYKFLAVAGIAFFLGSAGFAYREFERYQDRLLTIFREGEMANFNYAIVKEKMNHLQARKNELEEEKLRTGKPIPKTALKAFIKELDKVEPDLSKSCYERAQVLVKSLEFEQFKKYQFWYFLFCAIGAITGLLLSMIGFRLWYQRLQKPQDNATIANRQ
jgi:hypothetical protein